MILNELDFSKFKESPEIKEIFRTAVGVPVLADFVRAGIDLDKYYIYKEVKDE